MGGLDARQILVSMICAYTDAVNLLICLDTRFDSTRTQQQPMEDEFRLTCPPEHRRLSLGRMCRLPSPNVNDPNGRHRLISYLVQPYNELLKRKEIWAKVSLGKEQR